MFNETNITSEVLRAYMDSRESKEYKWISPSSLGGCMRKHFYHLKGIPATTPPNFGAMVNFQIGHLWESFIAKAYQEQGRLIKHLQDGVDEPWVAKEFGFGGTPDLIVTDTDGERVIVDAKTQRSQWFQYMRREVKAGGFNKWVASNSDYVYQQVCYILLARQNGYPDLRKAVLSFASKDDGYVGMELEITLTTDLAKKVLDRVKTLKGYVDNDILPPCECEGWKIGYCDYGNPATRKINSSKKEVNTECCSDTLLTK